MTPTQLEAIDAAAGAATRWAVAVAMQGIYPLTNTTDARDEALSFARAARDRLKDE